MLHHFSTNAPPMLHQGVEHAPPFLHQIIVALVVHCVLGSGTTAEKLAAFASAIL